MEELPFGHMFLHLKCKGCGLKKQMLVPAAPMEVGAVLNPGTWGQRANCLVCRRAQLEILNSCPADPPKDEPTGFRGMNEVGDPTE